jgi:predicted dienelactone hydrolase
VGVRHLEYVDFQRHERPMVLDVYYPALMAKHRDLFTIPFAKGFQVYKNPPVAFQSRKYLLILLSHGRSGNRFSLAWVAAALAAHGFIVGSMDHCFANSYHLSFEYVASKIWARPMDVSRHITHLLHQETWARYIDGLK